MSEQKLVVNGKMVIELDPRKNVWALLWYILLVELGLAYLIPMDIISYISFIEVPINYMGTIFPTLGEISNDGIIINQHIRFYLFISLCLMPIKIWIFYNWLNSSQMGVYRFFVISPLTNEKPIKGENYVADPIRQINKHKAKNEPRSLASRFIWSSLILLFTAGCVWMILETYSLNSADGIRLYKKQLLNGGLDLWFNWGLLKVLFTSLMLAISLCVLRDYKFYFKQKFFLGNQ